MTVTDSLMEKFMEWFKRDGEPAIKCFINSKVASDVILTKYKSLIPIEMLPKNERLELWNHVKSVFPDKPKDYLITACKIYYAMGTLA